MIMAVVVSDASEGHSFPKQLLQEVHADVCRPLLTAPAAGLQGPGAVCWRGKTLGPMTL